MTPSKFFVTVFSNIQIYRNIAFSRWFQRCVKCQEKFESYISKLWLKKEFDFFENLILERTNSTQQVDNVKPKKNIRSCVCRSVFMVCFALLYVHEWKYYPLHTKWFFSYFILQSISFYHDQVWRKSPSFFINSCPSKWMN